MTDPRVTQNELFAGKFSLVKLLGRGAMGEVWLANEVGPRNFKRQVAVKRLLATEGISEYARESFVAEAQVIARLDHPNIVRLIELGESDDRGLYLVLDYIEGAALDRIIRKGGPLSAGAVAFLGREVAKALDAVHSMSDDYGQNLGVVHRDVSPANILIGSDGRVRLSDFGVARIHGLGGEKTETGVFKGKLPYMPPEQALGEPFDGRADLFSLGITIHEALLGGRLRKAETQGQLIAMIATERVARVRDTVPSALPQLAQAIDLATEFRSDQRVSSAGHLVHLMQQVLHSMGPHAEEQAMTELCDRVALVTGGASQAQRQPWSLALSGEQASAYGGAAGHAPAGQFGQSGSNPSANVVSSGSHPSASGPPHATQHPSQRPPPPYGAIPASIPPPGAASVTRVATIRDASPAAPETGPLRAWGFALSAAIIIGCGAGAVWVLLRGTPPGLVAAAPTQAVAEDVTAKVTADAPASAEAAPQVAASPSGDAIVLTTSEPPAEPGTVPRIPRAGVPTPPSASANADDQSGTGTLVVVANPWGNVSVDGKPYGATPLPPITLGVGPHSVTVSNPELGSSRSSTVRIKGGQSSFVKFDFKKND